MDQEFEATTLIARPEVVLARAVLLVDDDELVLSHLSELVRTSGFEVHTASDGAAALEFIRRQFTPIVITDLDMPGMDGLALCRAIRQQKWPGYVYILVLTVHDGETDILAGLDAGADDYLSKRTSAAQLVARLHAAERILGLERALKVELEEKRRQSLTDPLTGAKNRRYFERQLQRDFKRTQRGGSPLSLLMLDIDHFKRINDQFGHAAGDAVLQELVRRVGQCLPRETDWCARVGGEEFIIVLGDTPLSGAARVAERIRQAIAGVPVATPARAISFTASIGVACFQPASNREPVSVESLLAQLDANMYRSKQEGRNRVTLPAAAIEPADGRRQLERDQADARPLRTILYIDDEPDLRLIVQAALGLTEGLSAYTAESGQALELAHELQPDLVLLDVMMPHPDGPGTLKLLRADAALSHIPAIFLTAKATPEEVVRLRALGAFAVIAKPFDPMRLSGQILALWQAMGSPAERAGAGAGQIRLQQQVTGLAGKFLERTGVQALTLTELAAHLQPGDLTGVASVHEIAHRIHGSGAMFDFPAVSACAGEVERLSHDLLERHPSIDVSSELQIRQRLQASIRQLVQAVESASNTQTSV
jgi:two-component system cell cycle response regulator